VPRPVSITVAVCLAFGRPFMPCGADLSGDLDLHQLLYQRTHRFAKEVHICSGLVKKLLQRDANVGGHGGFLLPCCCCSNTHGTRSWPLVSGEQPPSGIYTTTWDSSRGDTSSTSRAVRRPPIRLIMIVGQKCLAIM